YSGVAPIVRRRDRMLSIRAIELGSMIADRMAASSKVRRASRNRGCGLSAEYDPVPTVPSWSGFAGRTNSVYARLLLASHPFAREGCKDALNVRPLLYD